MTDSTVDMERVEMQARLYEEASKVERMEGRILMAARQLDDIHRALNRINWLALETRTPIDQDGTKYCVAQVGEAVGPLGAPKLKEVINYLRSSAIHPLGAAMEESGERE